MQANAKELGVREELGVQDVFAKTGSGALASSSEAADASALVLGEGERHLLADEAGGHSSQIRQLADLWEPQEWSQFK